MTARHLVVRVQPRARRTEVADATADPIRIRVAAPPVDGAANEALVAFLAGALGVPRARIAIVAGATGRTKQVAVEGMTPAEARRRLAEAAGDG